MGSILGSHNYPMYQNAQVAGLEAASIEFHDVADILIYSLEQIVWSGQLYFKGLRR